MRIFTITTLAFLMGCAGEFNPELDNSTGTNGTEDGGTEGPDETSSGNDTGDGDTDTGDGDTDTGSGDGDGDDACITPEKGLYSQPSLNAGPISCEEGFQVLGSPGIYSLCTVSCLDPEICTLATDFVGCETPSVCIQTHHLCALDCSDGLACPEAMKCTGFNGGNVTAICAWNYP